MNWIYVRTAAWVSGAVMGVIAGLLIAGLTHLLSGPEARLSAVTVAMPGPLGILAILLINLFASNAQFARFAKTLAERAPHLVAGEGRPAVARVHARLRPSAQRAVATATLPPHPEQARFMQFDVLLDGTTNESVFALVPTRYALDRGSPAVLLLDPENTDIALLDDRVTPETLAAVALDPRWTGARFPSMFVRQGGIMMLALLAAGTAVGFVIGHLLL